MAVTVEIRRKLDNFLLDINFHSDARRIGILGASGCGKSMTLKSIAGIELPDEGHIEVEGRIFFDKEKKINLKPQIRNVGYLFQNYALFPTMTVEKNIAAGLKGSKQEKEARVREMVEKFRLQGLEKRLPGKLSGGQQQRVALARIMAYEPEMILLDEPFSALDMYLKDQLQRELAEMLADYERRIKKCLPPWWQNIIWSVIASFIFSGLGIFFYYLGITQKQSAPQQLEIKISTNDSIPTSTIKSIQTQ